MVFNTLLTPQCQSLLKSLPCLISGQTLLIQLDQSLRWLSDKSRYNNNTAFVFIIFTREIKVRFSLFALTIARSCAAATSFSVVSLWKKDEMKLFTLQIVHKCNILVPVQCLNFSMRKNEKKFFWHFFIFRYQNIRSFEGFLLIWAKEKNKMMIVFFHYKHYIL